MRQMQTLAYCSSYTGASNLPAIELAERLSGLAYPSINTFFFTSGGAESDGELVQDGALLLEGAGQEWTRSRSSRAAWATTASPWPP